MILLWRKCFTLPPEVSRKLALLSDIPGPERGLGAMFPLLLSFSSFSLSFHISSKKQRFSPKIFYIRFSHAWYGPSKICCNSLFLTNLRFSEELMESPYKIEWESWGYSQHMFLEHTESISKEGFYPFPVSSSSSSLWGQSKRPSAYPSLVSCGVLWQLHPTLSSRV